MDCQPFSQMKKLRLDKLPSITQPGDSCALSPVLPGSRAPLFTSSNSDDKSNDSNNSKHSHHASYVPDTTQSHRSLLQALAIHGHANPPSNCLQQLLSVVQAHMQRKWDLWG